MRNFGFREGQAIVHDTYGEGIIKSTFMNGIGEIGYEVYFKKLGKIVTVMNEGNMRAAKPYENIDVYKSFADIIADKGGDVKAIGDALEAEPSKNEETGTEKSAEFRTLGSSEEEKVPANVQEHRKLCLALNDMYKKEGADYGDSFHKMVKEEGLAAARLYLTEKLDRFKRLSKNGNPQTKGESMMDSLMDIANYAIMTAIEMSREEAEKEFWKQQQVS